MFTLARSTSSLFFAFFVLGPRLLFAEASCFPDGDRFYDMIRFSRMEAASLNSCPTGNASLKSQIEFVLEQPETLGRIVDCLADEHYPKRFLLLGEIQALLNQ